MITVGDMDTPVVIQKQTYTASTPYGGVGQEAWELADAGISSVWAYMTYRGGSEKDEGDQQVGVQKVDFYIRYESYKDLIQPTWRIKHTLSDSSNVYFYIDSIAQIDGRHKMTKLTTVMKDNNPAL